MYIDTRLSEVCNNQLSALSARGAAFIRLFVTPSDRSQTTHLDPVKSHKSTQNIIPPDRQVIHRLGRGDLPSCAVSTYIATKACPTRIYKLADTNIMLPDR
jgi:hypothetical protein